MENVIISWIFSTLIFFFILYFIIASACKSNERLAEAKKQTLLIASIANKLDVSKDVITDILAPKED